MKGRRKTCAPHTTNRSTVVNGNGATTQDVHNTTQRNTQHHQSTPKSVYPVYLRTLQVVAGIKKAEKRPTPLFLNRNFVLQYKKDFNF